MPHSVDDSVPNPPSNLFESLGCTLPLRTTLVHEGRHTDARIWPAKKPSVVLLFICGNPGLIDYYEAFLSEIHATSPDTYEVIGLGHEGHSPEHPLSNLEALNRPDALRTCPLPSLQEQSDRKIAQYDQIRASYPSDVKLVLIGHSVGAYICQEVLKERPDIGAIYGLFPTISHIAISKNGLALSPLFTRTSITLVTTFLATLRWALPFAVLHLLVRFVTRQSPPASKVTAQLVASPGTVAASLAMAGDEMQTIKELDEDFLHRFGDKITFYFAAGSTDGWVGSEERVSAITTALDRGKAVSDTRKRWHICEKGMPHAFCLDHSSAMAELLAAWVAKDLNERA